MRLFSKLSDISRQRKLHLFYKMTSPSGKSKILDIGAEIGHHGGNYLQLIDSYPWKRKLSVVNLSAEHVRLIKKYYPEIDARVGDARELCWPDKYFDIVYSNAVIEHVGDLEDQKKMAAEVMRVGKQWFVTTPNRWYPFEFHSRLPLVTWLPLHSYLSISKLITYSYARQKYVFRGKYYDTRLLTSRKLQRLFPDSKIIKQRVTFMAETLIAVGGDIETEDFRPGIHLLSSAKHSHR